MTEPINLSYSDETDKLYGISGMAITLVACNGEDLLSEVRVDAPAGANMVMSHDFAFNGNPRMSAKIVWAQAMKDLRAVTSMTLGNIVCRRRLLRGTPVEDQLIAGLRDLVRGECADQCGLDRDEADALFGACHSYVERLFAHGAVCAMARRLAERLDERRTLSGTELVEYLDSMGLH